MDNFGTSFKTAFRQLTQYNYLKFIHKPNHQAILKPTFPYLSYSNLDSKDNEKLLYLVIRGKQ